MRCALCLMACRSWLCSVCQHHLDDVSALAAYRTRREKLLREIGWSRFFSWRDHNGMAAAMLRVHRRELADLRAWWLSRRPRLVLLTAA